MLSFFVLCQFFAKEKIESWNFSYDFEKNKCYKDWGLKRSQFTFLFSIYLKVQEMFQDINDLGGH